MKKAKGKVKRTAKKSVSKRVRRTKKPMDIARVRENITNLVGDSAEDIATEVIKVAKTGQLAPAKYLFEVAGLYPATEETAAKPEDSLAHTLLMRMGLPTEPVVCDEDPLPAAVTSGVKGKAGVMTRPWGEEGDQGDELKEEREPFTEGED